MQTKFRALRLVAGFYKVMAWLTLIAGILAAFVIVVVGAIAGRAGAPSPVLEGVPVLERAVGVFAGIAVGLGVIIAALVQFILFYAAGEVIHLGLAIEQNTRETAFYLRGEANIPPPPAPNA